jgi:hypothetical protein
MKSDPEEERNDNDAFDKYHTKHIPYMEEILYVGTR